MAIRMLESFSLFAAGQKSIQFLHIAKPPSKGVLIRVIFDAHIMQMSVQTRNVVDYFSARFILVARALSHGCQILLARVYCSDLWLHRLVT